MLAASLNNLISGGQQRFRDGEAERLGGLEVDDFILGPFASPWPDTDLPSAVK
jgi:hypothetical protein